MASPVFTEYQPKLPCKIASGSPVPPGGLLQLQSVTDGVWTVTAPTTASSPFVFLNGPNSLSPGERGEAVFEPIGVAAYNTDDGTPLIGEDWGSVNGGHLLKKGNTGFKIVGEPSRGLVAVARVSQGGGSVIAPCIANIALIPYFTSLECSGPDGNMISKMGHIAVGTGCGVFTGLIQVSGRVLDSESKGKSGVTISNIASGSSVTIATTGSDGTWSGSALIAIDNTGPAPAYFVEISAAGGTPSSIIYNNNPGPITGVNFTV